MEEALAEAKRCLNCPRPLCQMGCPIENEIPRFIQAIAHGNFGFSQRYFGRTDQLAHPFVVAYVHVKINVKGNSYYEQGEKTAYQYR